MPFFLYNPPLETCGRKKNVMYTIDSHITTREEVSLFFRHIVFDLNINFHPDDDFRDYVNQETDIRTMDDDTAELYNRLMNEAFEVCGDEVYEIGYDIQKERLNK